MVKYIVDFYVYHRSYYLWSSVIVKIGKYGGFCVYRRSYLLWSPVIVSDKLVSRTGCYLASIYPGYCCTINYFYHGRKSFFFSFLGWPLRHSAKIVSQFTPQVFSPRNFGAGLRSHTPDRPDLQQQWTLCCCRSCTCHSEPPGTGYLVRCTTRITKKDYTQRTQGRQDPSPLTSARTPRSSLRRLSTLESFRLLVRSRTIPLGEARTYDMHR